MVTTRQARRAAGAEDSSNLCEISFDQILIINNISIVGMSHLIKSFDHV